MSAAYSSMLRAITAFLALGATAASPVSREASADFEAVASKLAGTSRRGYIDGVRLDPGVRLASRFRFGKLGLGFEGVANVCTCLSLSGCPNERPYFYRREAAGGRQVTARADQAALLRVQEPLLTLTQCTHHVCMCTRGQAPLIMRGAARVLTARGRCDTTGTATPACRAWCTRLPLRRS